MRERQDSFDTAKEGNDRRPSDVTAMIRPKVLAARSRGDIDMVWTPY
jgi:hypothetical protein